MLTRILTVPELARAVRPPLSIPYVRALIDAGVIDGFISSAGWRGAPMHAADQLRAHEAQKAAAGEGKRCP